LRDGFIDFCVLGSLRKLFLRLFWNLASMDFCGRTNCELRDRLSTLVLKFAESCNMPSKLDFEIDTVIEVIQFLKLKLRSSLFQVLGD